MKTGIIARHEFQCRKCKNYSVKCHLCENMATSRPKNPTKEDKAFLRKVKGTWDSAFCAEHNGSIASFDSLDMRFDDLTDYPALFERKKRNMKGVVKVAGCCLAGGAVFMPAAFVAAPGLASALGSAGLLGAAGTGTAISSLSGAALTSASLAALGPAGMAGGVATIAAMGAALGATQGAVVSNSYFGEIKDFKITKVRGGKGPAIVCINGFLSQENQNCDDWRSGIRSVYPDNPVYYVTWESSNLAKLGVSLGGAGFKGKLLGKVGKAAARASKTGASKLNPLATISFGAGVLGNAWHTSMVKAQHTGVLLADLIARTDNDEGFILMGHSLGARVVYYLLETLSTKPNTKIHSAYLLGGAVGRSDKPNSFEAKGWETALKAIRSDGQLYNCYTANDKVLSILYRNANLHQSDPIGLGKIPPQGDKLRNVDVSYAVSGHTVYKDCLPQILKKLHRV
ncbi:TMCO4 family protein [bacterium]|nr:TMCO4 family protein [bacterium]